MLLICVFSPVECKFHTHGEFYMFCSQVPKIVGFSGCSVVKNLPFNVGDVDLIPGLGRSPGEGNGYRLQYSCLKNSMDIRAWRATVHGIAKNWTQLSDPVDFILFV